jgi:hypothetical protein
VARLSLACALFLSTSDEREPTLYSVVERVDNVLKEKT